MENILASIFNFIMNTPFAFGSFLLSLRSTMAFEPLPPPPSLRSAPSHSRGGSTKQEFTSSELILSIFYPLLKSQSGEQEVEDWGEPIIRKSYRVDTDRVRAPHTRKS